MTRDLLPRLRRVYGAESRQFLTLRMQQARALYLDRNATLDDVQAAAKIIADTIPIAERVFGLGNPFVHNIAYLGRGVVTRSREMLAEQLASRDASRDA